MFTEEIQKLAAAQVAERKARAEKKASTPQEAKQRPVWTPGAEWLLVRDALNDPASYWQWFIASTHHKQKRRDQIRICHLINAYVAGVPYAVLEKKTHVPVFDLACAMIPTMRAFGVPHSMEGVYAWLGVANPEKCFRQHMLSCPVPPESENVGASMA